MTPEEHERAAEMLLHNAKYRPSDEALKMIGSAQAHATLALVGIARRATKTTYLMDTAPPPPPSTETVIKP
jgi:hypothetical protein